MVLKESEKEEILDAVAEQIADLIADFKTGKAEVDSTVPYSDKYLDNMIEMKQRISAIETKMEKRLEDFEIIANNLEKQMSENYHAVTSENEKEYFKLVDQIANLRAAVIRLSNEIKEIKVQLALRKSKS